MNTEMWVHGRAARVEFRLGPSGQKWVDRFVEQSTGREFDPPLAVWDAVEGRLDRAGR